MNCQISTGQPLKISPLKSEIREAKHAVQTIRDGSSSIERAVMGLGRDSSLRRDYLQSRWQRAMEQVASRDKPDFHNLDLELWWSRRLKTPLGRALSLLEKI